MNQPSYRRKQKDAVSWLNQSSHGASLLATVRHHVELQQRLQAVLPAPWGAACSVMRWQDQVLTLGVPNAAHAAKIRQLTPSLTAGLRQVGWQVNGIRVRVQAGESVETEVKRLAMRPPREVRPLDRHDLEAFEALGSTLPEGPLAQSVARLLARHHVPPGTEALPSDATTPGPSETEQP